MLAALFEKLDRWIEDENHDGRAEGLRDIPKCEFKIVGQAALLEAKLSLDFAATVDLDAISNAKHEVIAKLNKLLYAEGLEFDPLSNEIWMPKETIYVDLFRGRWVLAARAEPDFIMVSKAKMAPEKNRRLLRSYIAMRPPDRFFKLCENYKVNLKKIIEV